MAFTGNTFLNDGSVGLSGLIFNGTATQNLNGYGDISTLTISNAVGVLLTDSQTITAKLQVKANSKLTIYSDLVLQ